MAIYEVFSHAEIRRYKTHIVSKATILQIVIVILTFVLPLIIAYRSQGFWRKTDTYRERADVKFKHEIIYLIHTDNGNFFTWSTYKNYNTLYMQQLRIPLVTSREIDTYFDGKNDKLHFKLEIPINDDENILGIDLLLFFEYKLYTYQRLTMECMADISYRSPINGNTLTTFGNLKFVQKIPLGYKGTNNYYNSSIVNGTSIFAAEYDLSSIYERYSKRNFSTKYTQDYSVWKQGPSINKRFTIDATIAYPEETLQFFVGFWQMIKWGWVQYASLLIIFLFVFDRIKIFIFCNQLVPTIVDRSIAKKVV